MIEQDEIRIRHMLDAAREVVTFSLEHSRDDLDTNQMLVRALSMSIGIIGEAASKVSPATQTAHTDIPWPQIIRMRNRIIHAYFDINLDLLWETVTTSIPELIPQLESLIPDEET